MKHFAGSSQAINGHDRVEALLPIRYLRDTILPSYRAGSTAARPRVDPSKANAAVTANRDLARTAAGESITLLRNEKGAGGGPALPLKTDLGKIVVAGPSAGCAAPGPACAAAVANQLGGWSVSWQGPFQQLDPADHRNCCIGRPDQVPDATTIFQGIKAACRPPTWVLAPDQQTAAVSEAATADAVVVAVGEKPYAEGLRATRAYLPGTEGGSAVADVLFGKVNPSGKLPVSWPSESTQSPPLSQFNPGAPSLPGDQPKFLDLLSGTNSGQGSGHNPLFAFGTGLSYTTSQTSALSVSGTVSARGSVTVTFRVADSGSRAGTDVVGVYVHQPLSDVVAPDRRLVAFTRVTLDPGAARTVQLSFPGLQAGGDARRRRRCGDAEGGGRRLPGGWSTT